jgi:hypothetical protein
MAHLSPDQLLDVAEETRTEREFPHLEACAVCASQLADLRSAIAAATEVQAPEPSPLFWDHLSARIRTAVAEDNRAARSFTWTGRAWWQWAAAAAVLGVMLLIIWPGSSRVAAPGGGSDPAVASVEPGPVEEGRAFDDDPAWALLADLSSGLDWDDAVEAGLVPAERSVESMVFALSAEERVELHRLLQEALAKAGA